MKATLMIASAVFASMCWSSHAWNDSAAGASAGSAALKHATPRYEPGVARVLVTEQRGELLRLLVQDTAGREDAMDARLRPGWCLMQSATVVIAFAARPLGSHTLLAHLEYQRLQTRVPHPGQPDDRSAALAKIEQELRVIETLAIQNRH